MTPCLQLPLTRQESSSGITYRYVINSLTREGQEVCIGNSMYASISKRNRLPAIINEFSQTNHPRAIAQVARSGAAIVTVTRELIKRSLKNIISPGPDVDTISEPRRTHRRELSGWYLQCSKIVVVSTLRTTTDCFYMDYLIFFWKGISHDSPKTAQTRGSMFIDTPIMLESVMLQIYKRLFVWI